MVRSASLSVLLLPLLLVTLASAAKPQAVLYELAGDGANDHLGVAVAGAGDLDGDGHADFLACSPGADANVSNGGRVRVWSGRNGAVLYDVDGDDTDGQLGTALVSVGDVDGDGVPDLALGSEGYGSFNPGRVQIVSGADGSVLHTVSGDTFGDSVGASVAAAGDVDLDGVPDLLVGSPGEDSDGTDAGRAQIVSGATFAVLATFDGEAAFDRLGTSVAGLADQDADGVPDALVGAPYAEVGPFGTDAGKAYVVSGASGAVLHELRGQAFHHFGAVVSAAGDVDDDGLGDFVVGAPGANPNGFDSGRAIVFGGEHAAILHVLDGQAGGDALGTRVASAGDVDDDGHADVAVAAPLADGVVPDVGVAAIHSGATGAVLHAWSGQGAFTNLGYGLAPAGDVNGDGRPDLLVGAPSETQADVGVVRVHSADGSGLPSAAWIDLGGGTAGVAGVPALALSGSLTATSTLSLDLTGGAPASVAVLFLSVGSSPAPFLGGTLHALPFVQLFVLVTDGAGGLHGATTFPEAAPGLQLWFQVAVQDASVPAFGASLSNAVRGTAP